MLRPSGAICGSETHCKSNTSMGLRLGFVTGASTGAPTAVAVSSNTAIPISIGARRRRCSSGALGDPAIALMFIDDPYGLHVCVTNGRTDETKAAALQFLAHRLAQGRGSRDRARIQRPASQHAPVSEFPDIGVKGAGAVGNLEVSLGVRDEGIDLKAVAHDAGILQQAS